MQPATAGMSEEGLPVGGYRWHSLSWEFFSLQIGTGQDSLMAEFQANVSQNNIQ